MDIGLFPAVQVIRDDDGRPKYAVLPWDDYLELKEMALGIDSCGIETFMPPEVEEARLRRGVSLMRAWREHLGMSQAETAKRIGVSRGTYARMENAPKSGDRETLKRIAKAMGLDTAQIMDKPLHDQRL